jgi:transcriptional regulator with PAS, ATPase and Fis domain
MNRNSIAECLWTLLISGQAKAKIDRTSKVNTFSRRVPVSAMMDFSSDMTIMVDKSGWIIHADDCLIQFACIQREALIRQQVDQCHFSPKYNDFGCHLVL